MTLTQDSSFEDVVRYVRAMSQTDREKMIKDMQTDKNMHLANMALGWYESKDVAGCIKMYEALEAFYRDPFNNHFRHSATVM